MKKLACRYAVVQFMPYTETGEFANVGVVLMCPETGYFDFRLQLRKYARVTAFFEELPPHVYRHGVQLINLELTRIAQLVAAGAKLGQADYLRQIFEGLLHPREALIRFRGARVILTTDPAQELQHQFDHYVDRAFVTPEFVEGVIEKRLKALLSTLDLPAPFRPAKVGDDEVYARFPLVQQRAQAISKIIKPFNLNQHEPMGIYDHGSVWLQRVRRLRKRNLLPHDVLFAVAGPPEADGKRTAAYREICTEFEAEGIRIESELAQDRIVQFALARTLPGVGELRAVTIAIPKR
mgnify:CR=1 FL=1